MADEPKKKYRVLDTLAHDGEVYGPAIKGKATVEMTETQAGALPEGVVELVMADVEEPAPEKPAAKKSGAKKPAPEDPAPAQTTPPDPDPANPAA